MPIYLVAVAVGIVVFLVVKGEDAATATSISGTTEISANCVAIKVFGTSACIPAQHSCSFEGNAPLTTVMVEMWLYVAYAAICFVLLRGVLRESFFWPILGLVWLAGLFWVSIKPEHTDWWHNGSLIGFLGYWWIGAKFTDPDFAGWMRRLTIPIAAAWIGLTVILMNDPGASIFLVELRKILLALLFGIGIAAIESLADRGAHSAAKLGQSGYSIYAFHAPILILLLILGVPWYLVFARRWRSACCPSTSTSARSPGWEPGSGGDARSPRGRRGAASRARAFRSPRRRGDLTAPQRSPRDSRSPSEPVGRLARVRSRRRNPVALNRFPSR